MVSIEKPWGHEKVWANNENYAAKFLHINAGSKLSLQYHVKKQETIYVLEGKLYLHYGSKDRQEVKVMSPGETFHIKPRMVHRFEARDVPIVLVEVSTPELDDIVRLEDDYGRAAR